MESTKQKRIPVLIADIGGTNSRLSISLLTSQYGEFAEEINYKKFESHKFPRFVDLIKAYLKDFEGTEHYPVYGVAGMPGFVVDNNIEFFANLPETWNNTNGAEIAKELRMKSFVVLNDFVIAGYGVLSPIKLNQDYLKLNEAPVHRNGQIALVGPGTGMGHGVIVKPEKVLYKEVFPSEGGHQSFAPQNEREFQYMMYLKKYFGCVHVSQERACSGPALPAMFNFFVDREKMSSPVFTSEEHRRRITPEEIVQNANSGKCPVCVQVRKFFAELLGTSCSNFALATIPLGGLYLLGGLGEAFSDFLIKDRTFIDRFCDKGRMSELMRKIPIFVVLNKHMGLRGGEEFTRRMIEEHESN